VTERHAGKRALDALEQIRAPAVLLGDEREVPHELSEDDRLTVSRARKIQRFLSQPFFVAQQFTGIDGKYVPIAETIRGFREIVEGKHDGINEQDFFLAGSIDDVVAKAAKR